MDTYEKVKYSRSKIEKAGKVIAEKDESSPEYAEFLQVVDNWRAAHAYPLDLIAHDINNCLGNMENIYVAQRLKRLESIIGKLKRPENTGLYRMQDLSGCRVIVPNVEDVYTIVELVKGCLIKKGHTILSKEYDYLRNPPEKSGYRSYHFVVAYHGNPDYDGMLVEVQVRTRLQHSWATAVEIMDCVTNDTLKAGTGKAVNTYFFKLVSGLFSLEENTTVVKGIPSNKQDIVKEIYRVDNTESVREKLSAYSNAITISGQYPGDAGYYILTTDMRRRYIDIKAYKRDALASATQVYLAEEKQKVQNGIDIVLVSARSFSMLRECYPNYFLEAQEFLSKVATYCSEYPEMPRISINTSDKSLSIRDYFSAEYYQPNILKEIEIEEDGIGENDGELFFCPPWAMTLPYSYLRYSGITWKKTEILEDIEPINIKGPGIIVAHTGACFYVDREEWQYISAVPTMVIQAKEGIGSEWLIFFIGWLKSNLCIWDILWNRHSNSIYNKRVFMNYKMPYMEGELFSTICELTKKIFKLEFDFVERYNYLSDYGEASEAQKAIDTFNECIIDQLHNIDEIINRFYDVSEEDIANIKYELRLKGYYTY